MKRFFKISKPKVKVASKSDNVFVKNLLGVMSVVVLGIFISFILTLSVRGIAGNPKSDELNTSKWTTKGPLELSPERGRYALLYSIVEDDSFIFSTPIARLATPDLGYANGNYVSLFAPFVSFAMIPGYILGSFVGLAQVGAYLAIAIFAVLNALLIRYIAIKLGAGSISATIGGLIFTFASPAFAYAVTLYQHHLSTFLILASLAIILKTKSLWSLPIIWFLFAMSIPVDYPNLFLMMPIALLATTRILWAEKNSHGIRINFRLLGLLTPITILIPLAFYVWFSLGSYNKPFQLAGTVESVNSIDSNGNPSAKKIIEDSNFTSTVKKEKKSALAFFQTRNILNGLYIHFISPDRGLLIFTPIMLFGVVGFIVLYKRNQTGLAVISGVIGANIALYSMWGDPWGGWAFGSRYLIPTYAMLSILIAIALARFNGKSAFLILFFIVGAYSVSVNTLGALTSNSNPPKVEVLTLESLSGKQERYSFDRNIENLLTSGSKSFVYNTYLKSVVTPVNYFFVISGILTFTLATLLVVLRLKKYE